jgi:hypothetical protein
MVALPAEREGQLEKMEKSIESSVRMQWECHFCRIRISRPVLCSECGAIIYCSAQHRNLDASHTSDECSRMKCQMSRSGLLDVLGRGASMYVEISGSRLSICSQLQAWDVHGKHPFSRLCACWEASKHVNSGNEYHCCLDHALSLAYWMHMPHMPHYSYTNHYYLAITGAKYSQDCK